MKTLNELLRGIDSELFDAFLQNTDRDMLELTNERILKLVRQCSTGELDKTAQTIKTARQFSQGIRESLTAEEIKIFCAGMNAGSIVAVGGILEELEMENIARQLNKKCEYFFPIVYALSKSQSVCHDDLAKQIGLSEKKLRDVMNIINESRQKYVISSEVGTFSYYLLSDAGRRFVLRNV